MPHLMEVIMASENPASRLNAVLQVIISAKGSSSARHVWADALQIDSADQAKLMIGIGETIKAATEVAALMNEKIPAIKSQTDEWLGWINTAFFSQAINAHIDTFKQHYPVQASYYLQMAADLLEPMSAKPMPLEQLQKFKDALYQVKEDVLASGLEPKVVEYLVKSIQKILTALDQYVISGSVPVIDSIELLVGHAFVDRDYGDALRTSVGQKVMNVVGLIANAMAITAGVSPDALPKLGQQVVAMITQEG